MSAHQVDGAQVASIQTDREILTVEQAADLLQVQVATIYAWTHKRSVPFFRVGKYLRFDRVELLAHFRKGGSR